MSQHITINPCAAVAAKTEIDIPSGIKLKVIRRASKIDQVTPGNSLNFTREISYADGDIAANEVALSDGTTAKAIGRAFKLGTALAAGDLAIIEGILSGEIQSYGDGT